jgi:hypothetical protein
MCGVDFKNCSLYIVIRRQKPYLTIDSPAALLLPTKESQIPILNTPFLPFAILHTPLQARKVPVVIGDLMRKRFEVVRLNS